jgi:hypothetical protein
MATNRADHGRSLEVGCHVGGVVCAATECLDF